MNRRVTHRLIAGLLLVAAPAGALTACGGSDDATDATSAPADQAADANQTADTVPAGATLPELDDVTLPENLPVSGECAELYQQFITALSKAGSGEDFQGLETAIATLADSVPDDLKDDVAVLSDAYGQMADLIAEHGGDLATAAADPEVQAQMEAIGTEAVTDAGDKISDYFDETCPELNQS